MPAATLRFSGAAGTRATVGNKFPENCGTRSRSASRPPATLELTPVEHATAEHASMASLTQTCIAEPAKNGVPSSPDLGDQVLQKLASRFSKFVLMPGYTGDDGSVERQAMSGHATPHGCRCAPGVASRGVLQDCRAPEHR